MKKITTLSLVCILISTLYAYNYQTVLSNRVTLFQSTSGMISGMKIDSVIINGDSIFYPLKNIQRIGDYCFDAEGASWLGGKIIVSPEWNCFFNADGDSIKIKTNAQYHESWKLLENSAITVEAMVNFHDTMTVLGLVDSVKTIDLQAYYKSEPTGVFAHGILLLSKHFGLIKTYNLHVFPGNHSIDSPTDGLEVLTLIGVEDSESGVQNLRWFDVFDFQPGDEFHTVEESFLTTAGPATSRQLNNIRQVKSREDYADSIVYQVQDRRESRYTHGQELISYEFSDEEKRIVITQNPVFDVLPGRPYILNDYLFSYHMELQNDIVCKGNSGIPYSEFRACWSDQPDEVSDVCYTDKTLYYKGLGGPYYNRISGCWVIDSSTETRTLLYYKKGTVAWGTPIVISGMDKVTGDSGITVYRNAIKDVLCVNLSDPDKQTVIEVYNLFGVMQFDQALFHGKTEIDLKTLYQGMYVYRVCMNGKAMKSGKFVK